MARKPTGGGGAALKSYLLGNTKKGGGGANPDFQTTAQLADLANQQGSGAPIDPSNMAAQDAIDRGQLRQLPDGRYGVAPSVLPYKPENWVQRNLLGQDKNIQANTAYTIAQQANMAQEAGLTDRMHQTAAANLALERDRAANKEKEDNIAGMRARVMQENKFADEGIAATTAFDREKELNTIKNLQTARQKEIDDGYFKENAARAAGRALAEKNNTPGDPDMAKWSGLDQIQQGALNNNMLARTYANTSKAQLDNHMSTAMDTPENVAFVTTADLQKRALEGRNIGTKGELTLPTPGTDGTRVTYPQKMQIKTQMLDEKKNPIPGAFTTSEGFVNSPPVTSDNIDGRLLGSARALIQSKSQPVPDMTGDLGTATQAAPMNFPMAPLSTALTAPPQPRAPMLLAANDEGPQDDVALSDSAGPSTAPPPPELTDNWNPAVGAIRGAKAAGSGIAAAVPSILKFLDTLAASRAAHQKRVQQSR